jgi:hypothetical protein
MANDTAVKAATLNPTDPTFVIPLVKSMLSDKMLHPTFEKILGISIFLSPKLAF